MSKARNLATLLTTDGSVKPTKYADSVGGQSTFVASGTLPNGVPVILKADGTIEVVAGTVTNTAETIPTSSNVSFDTGTYNTSVSFDPSTTGVFVIAYVDGGNSSYGTAIVGNVSGTSISFGSPHVFNSGANYEITVTFDPNTAGKIIISYRSATSGIALVGTLSGNSISFGANFLFNSSVCYNTTVAFDPNTAGKFVVAFRDGGNNSGNNGTAVVGTVSGTSISFSSKYVFNVNRSNTNSISFDPSTAGKFVIGYADGGDSYYGKAIVGTLSGTSISYGTPAVFNTAYSNDVKVSSNPTIAGKFVIVYSDNGNSGYGTALVASVSGNSVSFGSPVVFNDEGTTSFLTVSNQNATGRVAMFYRNETSGSFEGRAVVGIVTGNSITFSSQYVVNTGNTPYTSISFDSTTVSTVIFVYVEQATSGNGAVKLAEMGSVTVGTNLTADNFIGIPNAAYADGETATVKLQGSLATNLSGLTASETYYVQNDGTLDTTADSISVEAGKALSSTSILLKGI